MQKNGKLELTWVGKYDKQEPLEPRILIEKPELSYGDSDSGNMLIHGDNLIALRALEQDFAGKVKCIYIDPPYNINIANPHYEDGLEHSEWLCLMKPRLELLWSLLSGAGSIWISIDDYEYAYMKVLCDEAFGRKNFVTTIVWQMRKSRENRRVFSNNHEYLLCYAKTPAIFANGRNTLPLTNEVKNRYKNPDNDPRGEWQSVSANAQAGHGTTSQFYTYIAPNGKKHVPPKGRCWLYTNERMNELVKDGRIWLGSDGNGVPRVKKYLSEVNAGLTPETLWLADDAGTNDSAKKMLINMFPEESVFETPKPEELIMRILLIASNPNDLVLDSFLGSGTTSAVAHKMDRRWIGIELGEHAYTHCKVRLDKVVDGEQGGISEVVGWQGGGGYKFYELAPSLLEKHPILPVYRVNKEYTFEMLCEAICKLEGFFYKPEGEMHGHSSESRFIHIAREFVSGDYITKLMKEVGDKQSILIYGVKIQSNLRLPDNVEVKKIPKDLLKKCKFESEVR